MPPYFYEHSKRINMNCFRLNPFQNACFSCYYLTKQMVKIAFKAVSRNYECWCFVLLLLVEHFIYQIIICYLALRYPQTVVRHCVAWVPVFIVRTTHIKLLSQYAVRCSVINEVEYILHSALPPQQNLASKQLSFRHIHYFHFISEMQNKPFCI